MSRTVDPEHAPGTNYGPRIAKLIAELRKRDADPACQTWPIMDAYARLSRVAEDADLEKPERQIFDVLSAMLKADMRLGEVLSDPGRSAWKKDGKRPAFDRLLARMEARESHGAFCWHLDRLLRQSWDLAKLIHMSEFYIIASCSGKYKLASDSDRFALRVLVAAAENESDAKSRRLRRKAERSREQGFTDGSHNVFGHRYRTDVGITDKQLKAERAALLWAIRSIVDGGSLQAIATEWTRRGVMPRRGATKWTPPKVRAVVLRPRHAGLIEHYDYVTKTTTITGPLRDGTVPIVTVEEFTDMSAIFKARGRGRPASKDKHVLTGHVWCHCGTRMNGEAQNHLVYPETGEPRRNYRCPPRGCHLVRIDARIAEEWTRDEVIRTLAKPSHARAIAKRSASMSKLDGEIHALELERQKAAERLGDGRMTFDSYDRAESGFVRRLAAKRAERERLVAVGGTSQAVETDALSLAALWDDESTTVEDRRKLINIAFPHGVSVAASPRRGHVLGTDAVLRLSVRTVASVEPAAAELTA